MGSVLQVQFNQQQAQMICGECGINFSMPEAFREERQEHGKTWYCPNGHPRVYRESDVDRLKKQLAEKERLLAAERERASLNYAAREKAERELKKVKRRVGGGVCPCCNRTFLTLGRHMKTKHPEYQPK
jgi:transposase-like protein